LAIITSDSDFAHLSRDRGAPPNVIHIERCTFRTDEVESLIRRNAIRIAEFDRSYRALMVITRNG
jgi:predicted nuclease of predicted toxin-antitoxin system